MKRSIAAVAALSLSAPALALDPEINFRGQLALSLSYFNSNDQVPGSVTDIDLENNDSHFRVAAAAQEAGINAFMVYERVASNDQLGVEDVAEFYGGISGSIGTLIYGRKATDYRIAGERLDPFYDTSVAGANGGFASVGAGYGLSSLTNGETPNTISFRTPVAGGFTGNLSAYINDNDSDTSTGDKTDVGVGIGYANNNWLGLDAGIQALGLNDSSRRPVAGSPGEAQAYRLHASIGEKLWALGLSLEYVDVEDEEEARKYAFLSGTYQITEKWRLASSIGHLKDTSTIPGTGAIDGTGVTVGAFHDLTRHFSYYFAARYVVLDDAAETKNATLASGVEFAFETGL